MKAYHVLDIPFAFNNVDLAASMTGAMQERYKLAHKMSAAFASFARTGNPNHADLSNWPAFNPHTYPMVAVSPVTISSNGLDETTLNLRT